MRRDQLEHAIREENERGHRTRSVAGTYVDSSNFAGWDVALAQSAASAHNFLGLTEQSLYNLAVRAIEQELIPALPPRHRPDPLQPVARRPARRCSTSRFYGRPHRSAPRPTRRLRATVPRSGRDAGGCRGGLAAAQSGGVHNHPSDVTDEQWALIGPFLDAWRATRVSVAGRRGEQDLREIVNAILYQSRTGCQWAYLPHDLPPKSATYYYFALWRDDGTDAAVHGLLRCQAREKAGRTEDPSAVAVDTQSIRAANHVPAATTGKDAGKKVPGRKRRPQHRAVAETHRRRPREAERPGQPQQPDRERARSIQPQPGTGLTLRTALSDNTHDHAKAVPLSRRTPAICRRVTPPGPSGETTA